MTATVIVLNASYEPLHTVSVQHAIKMLVREVVAIEEHEEGRTIGPFPYPKVLRLLKYVYIKVRNRGRQPRYSRTGVLRRDKHCCAYCGKAATTIDHIIPRSKGGESSWLNTVAACRKCNERKANKTLKQAGMVLLFEPYVPAFMQFVQ